MKPKEELAPPVACYTVDEFSTTHRVGRTTIYKEIASGRLAAMKIGKATRISAEAAARWRALCEASPESVAR